MCCSRIWQLKLDTDISVSAYQVVRANWPFGDSEDDENYVLKLFILNLVMSAASLVLINIALPINLGRGHSVRDSVEEVKASISDHALPATATERGAIQQATDGLDDDLVCVCHHKRGK